MQHYDFCGFFSPGFVGSNVVAMLGAHQSVIKQ